MAMYRERSSGVVKSPTEVKAAHSNVSFSSVVDTFDDLGWDEIVAVNMPAPSSVMKEVVEAVPALIASKWTQVWEEVDKFTTDSDSTKAEKETAYQVKLDANAAIGVRQKRDSRLLETDWLGLSDVTMSAAWATYRQALRDVPAQNGFPNNVTWPEEP